METTQQNKSNLNKANAAFAEGDFEGFLSYCTDDTKWTYVGDLTIEGKEAVRKYLHDTYTGSSKFTTEKLIAEGDYVTLLGDITLKEEDGKETHYTVCDVWRFREGKMAELRAFAIKD